MENHFDIERSGWFSELSSMILKGAGEHPALEPHRYRTDLGDVDITRAILVALITERHTNGEGLESIAEWVHPLEIFSTPLPDDVLFSLVDWIEQRWASSQLWNHVNKFMPGMGLWDPNVVSSSLSEYWTSRRAAVVPQARIRRELVGCWGVGVEIPELIDAWLEYPLNPFDGHVANFDIFDGEETKVTGLGLTCLNSTFARNRSRSWTESLNWDYSRQMYLVEFGRQVRQLQDARIFLDRSMKMEGFPENLIGSAKRVREIMAGQEERHRRTLSALTSHEVFLLTDRDDDRIFTESCVATYIAQRSENTRWEAEQTSIGMWGQLPWGSIAVRGHAQVEAAKKVLRQRVQQITLSVPPGSSASLRLSLDMRHLHEAGVDTGFAFSPRHAHDLCRLLLISLRRGFCLEFVELRWNEELEHDETFPIGAYGFSLDPDILDEIHPWTLSRLRRLLPEGPLSDGQTLDFISPDHGPLADLLRRPTYLDPWS